MNITIKSSAKRQVIDITDIIESTINKFNFTEAVSVIVVKHTTSALTTADLDPGTDLDLLAFLTNLIPDLD